MLKPCPFCGHAAQLNENRAYRRQDTGEMETGVSISCPACPAEMLVPDADLATVGRLWNMRTSETL